MNVRLRYLLALCALCLPLSLASSGASAQDADGAVDSTTAAPGTAGTPGAAAEDIADTSADSAEGEVAEEEAEEEEAEEAQDAPAIEDDLAAEADAEAEAEAAPEGEEDAPAASEPLIWRSSLFFFQQGLTINSMAPGLGQSPNPTYYHSYTLQPRLYLDGQNFLVLTQGLSIEWTDGDFTTRQFDPYFSDTTLEWRHIEVVEGFVLLTSVRLQAPVSLPSIAAQRVLNTGLGLTIVRVFPELASLTLAASLAYRRWWGMSNVTVARDSSQCQDLASGSRGPTALQDGSLDSCGTSGAFTTERDRFLGGLTLSIQPISGLTLSTQYFYTLAIGNDVTPYDGIEPQSTDHFRPAQYFSANIAYDFLPWLNVLLGYQTGSGFARMQQEDGTYLTPFWDPMNSEVYIAATFVLDGIYEALAGGEDDGLTPEQRQRRRQGLSAAPAARAAF